MDKKDVKWYETPAMELVSIDLQGFVCNSPGSNPFYDGTADTGIVE